MIIGRRIYSRFFVWDVGTSHFTAEISELQHANMNVFGQLYDDACDQGFVMVSDKTYAEVAFYLQDTRYDEGEIQFWKFKPTYEAVLKNSKLEHIEVIVYND